MTTPALKPNQINRNWHVVDAKDQILGRMSSEIAKLLIGKHKPNRSPHLDSGDYVVVINAKDIQVTGNKLNQKRYYHHTNYPGGLRTETLKNRLGRDPKKVIEHSVKGMLPKNKLQTPRLRRLKVFVDATHPYDDKLKSDTKLNK